MAKNVSDSAEELVTRSGLALHVRRVNEADAAALATFFDSVDPDDLRFRFLSAQRHVSDEQIKRMIHVDHSRTEDFIATLAGEDAIVGCAMMAADPAMATAEVAISVRKDMKGRGIGWTLLEHVARAARAWGIKTLQSIESRDNHAAIELEREMGFTARPVDGDPALVLLEIDLR